MVLQSTDPFLASPPLTHEQLRSAVTARRVRYLTLGYEPIPVVSGRKRPAINGWQDIRITIPPDEDVIALWADTCPNALSTGVRTSRTPAVDIDILDQNVAAEVENVLLNMLPGSGTILKRTGKPPKRLIPFRCETPFKKMATTFTSPDGVTHKVEVLADGQQFVCEGIHETTLQPYRWADNVDLLTVAHEHLPLIDDAFARRFIAEASKIMRHAGWAEVGSKANGKTNGKANGRANGKGHDSTNTGATEWRGSTIYGRTALRAECDKLAGMAKDSGRNNALNVAAFNLFCLVAGGELDEDKDQVRARLFAAAEDCGLVADDGAMSVRATIESGAKAGRAKPRQAAGADRTRPRTGDWRDDLLLTPTKQPKPLLRNAIIALRQAPEWEGVLAYDEFALATMAMKPPPWLKAQDNTWMPQRWADRDDTLATDWLQGEGIGIGIPVAAAAVEAVAKDASFHPVRDYLNGLRWDGTERVARFATAYLGAGATAYHSEVSKCMLIAAVARIMQPGCKHDHMPILEAPQGSGKSKAIAALFTPWFTDDLAELGSKDASMQVRAAWGVEVAELAAMTRGEIERMKAFITRQVDRFRPSYGRRVIEAPRQSVFIGSTNADAYLKDETGGRRFWPIRCGAIDHDALVRDRDQLWAEAVTLYNAGASWWLTESTAIAVAREQQDDRHQDDPWYPEIVDYCQDRADVSIEEILSNLLGIERARWTQQEQNRVARCLTRMAWERYRGPRPGRKWRYRRLAPVGPSTD